MRDSHNEYILIVETNGTRWIMSGYGVYWQSVCIFFGAPQWTRVHTTYSALAQQPNRSILYLDLLTRRFHYVNCIFFHLVCVRSFALLLYLDWKLLTFSFNRCLLVFSLALCCFTFRPPRMENNFFWHLLKAYVSIFKLFYASSLDTIIKWFEMKRKHTPCVYDFEIINFDGNNKNKQTERRLKCIIASESDLWAARSHCDVLLHFIESV